MKNILIAGNWKMNTNAFESAKLAEYIVGAIRNIDLAVKVLVCPPFTSIETVARTVKGTMVKLGAQNCHSEHSGAYTGEVSIPMIKYLGASHIIIGHSERRAMFGETDELINQKMHAILGRDMKAIVCIGETIEERRAGKTFDVLANQIQKGLAGLTVEKATDVIVAYEPVWAIGTGESASDEQVDEAHKFIRAELGKISADKAKDMFILYGGSMNAGNADSLLAIEDVNGGLIGGASLKGESFLSIIKSGQKLIEG